MKIPWWRIGLVCLVFEALFIFMVHVAAPPACAGPARVFVDPTYENAAVARMMIESRLNDQDGISVSIQADDSATPVLLEGPITLRTFGEDRFTVDTTGDWPDSVWLTDRLLRVKQVTRGQVDGVLRMIREIHTWQLANPKPEPPPPPAPPADYSWLWTWLGIVSGSVVFFLVVRFVLRAYGRKKAREAELIRRFDTADPNDLYGPYKPADLGE